MDRKYRARIINFIACARAGIITKMKEIKYIILAVFITLILMYIVSVFQDYSFEHHPERWLPMYK